MKSHLRRYRPSRRHLPAIVFACEAVERRLLLASVGGTVFHDLNANGVQDPSEGLQSGFRIYVDENDNGVFDAGERSTLSDELGNWRIDGLGAGEHVIRQHPRDGFVPIPSTPIGGGYEVNIPSAQSSLDGYDFGNFRFARASGRVFFDNTGNGREDGADTGMSGITVFIDANDNGVLDAGERSTQTNVNGDFRIDFVRPGFTRVRVVEPTDLRASNRTGYGVVFPSGWHAENLNFGLTDIGEIRGRVFSDLNGDTFQGRLEPGVADRAVFLDFNQNGVLDSGESVVLTDVNGNYTFRGLKPGRYRVQVVGAPGIEIVRPQTRGYAIALAPGQIREDVNFALAPLGGFRGFVYHDQNLDGVRNLVEPGIAKRSVFLDLNANGVFDAGEPSVLTGATGEYRFTNMLSGSYFVDTVLAPGEFKTAPASRHRVVVQPGQMIGENDFGVALQGYISGTVFSDVNGNRAFEVDEPRLANRRVFVDSNNDGAWNPGEISTMTDDLGRYVLGGLNPGQYVVRTTPIPGSIQSKPADGAWVVDVQPATVARHRDFGFTEFAMLSGNVYNDINANGQRDPGDTARSGAVVFLDNNANGVLDAGEATTITDANGAYFFTSLASGVYHVRTQVPAGFGVSEPGPGFYSVFLGGGEDRFNLNFGLFEQADVGGVVYSDLDSNGTRDGGEPTLAGRRVFLDLNGNGAWGASEPNALTDVNGEYLISDVRPGDYRVRVVTSADEDVTEPVTGFHDITLASGQTLANQVFGIQPPPGISGVVWADANGDGVRDGGEIGLAGRTVFIDEDNDGVFDPDEPSFLTAADGAYTFTNLPAATYNIRIVTDADDVITHPAGEVHTITLAADEVRVGVDFGLAPPAQIGGIVYHDLDGNGDQGAGETPLTGVSVWLDLNDDGVRDITEPLMVTNANGEYVFTISDFGTYVVRVLPTVRLVSEPASGFHSVTVGSGDSNLTNDFGLTDPGTITGLVWNDLDGNGLLDAGELGLPNETVYLDLNGNGVLDVGERSVLTSAGGLYSIDSLLPGTHKVRVDVIAPQIVTAPAGEEYDVLVTPGGVIPNQDFGIQ